MSSKVFEVSLLKPTAHDEHNGWVHVVRGDNWSTMALRSIDGVAHCTCSVHLRIHQTHRTAGQHSRCLAKPHSFSIRRELHANVRKSTMHCRASAGKFYSLLTKALQQSSQQPQQQFDAQKCKAPVQAWRQSSVRRWKNLCRSTRCGQRG